MALTRMWINTPSKAQAAHCFHGKNVLVNLDEKGEYIRVYFTTGAGISAVVSRVFLEDGWKEDKVETIVKTEAKDSTKNKETLFFRHKNNNNIQAMEKYNTQAMEKYNKYMGAKVPVIFKVTDNRMSFKDPGTYIVANSAGDSLHAIVAVMYSKLACNQKACNLEAVIVNEIPNHAKAYDIRDAIWLMDVKEFTFAHKFVRP